jgi:hypothetical protein
VTVMSTANSSNKSVHIAKVTSAKAVKGTSGMMDDKN